MASYRDRAIAAEEALAKFQRENDPVQRLLSHSVLVESALKVLSRHNLMDEFAAEVSGLRGIADNEQSVSQSNGHCGGME